MTDALLRNALERCVRRAETQPPTPERNAKLLIWHDLLAKLGEPCGNC